MSTIDPSALTLMLAIPVLVAVAWSRRRTGTRRVAGMFLWTDAQRSAGSRMNTMSFDTAALLRSAGSIVLLTMLTGISFAAAPAWTGTLWRIGLCTAVAILLLANWRSPAVSDTVESAPDS